MGRFLFIVVAVGIAFSFYKGWVGQWFETAVTTSAKEAKQARSNPRSDKYSENR
jgi:hypothetical protein